jgi:K+-transporting ATPase KdpF subunit
LRANHGYRASPIGPSEARPIVSNVIGLVVAIGFAVFLVLALIFAERF